MDGAYLSHLVSSTTHSVAMKSRSRRFTTGSRMMFAVCCLALDRRCWAGRPDAPFFGLYTGVGFVRIETYERDIVGGDGVWY
jgi:hypothetical protein